MKHSANQLQTSAAQNLVTYPPIELETRSHVPTACAAFWLSRAEQTLRVWAMNQPSGMPRPLRINGRLAWRVSDIRALLNGGA